MRGKDLEKRREQILEFVIASFIDSAAPVGSSAVSTRFNRRYSSATIRNDMAELEELGLLRQPHTSAGRIPTDKGYRFYVDRLIKEEPVPPQLQIDIAREMERGASNLEGVLSAALRILSCLTHQAGFILLPDWQEDHLKRVQLSIVTPRRLLGSWLMASGGVFSRVFDMSEDLDADLVAGVSEFLNQEAQGHTLFEIGSLLDREIEEGDMVLMRLRQLARSIWEMARVGFGKERLLLEGYQNMLDQPEFQDVGRVRSLISALEDKQDLLRIIRKDLGREDVRIHIGREDFSESMSECALISAGYAVKGRPVGVLGVLGPRRMSYPRVIGSCRYMARLVGGILGEAGL